MTTITEAQDRLAGAMRRLAGLTDAGVAAAVAGRGGTPRSTVFTVERQQPATTETAEKRLTASLRRLGLSEAGASAAGGRGR